LKGLASLMSFLSFFHWLAHTSLSIALRDSTWGFATIEIVHLITLAFFGGAVLFVDLRLLGLSLKSQPAPIVAREFLPITGGGVIVMLITGSLLLASGPMRYYYNTPFRIKMWLFFIALFFHFAMQISIARRNPDTDRETSLRKVGGVLSLLLWATIGIAGRAIGYF
jgi:hypothetical protein